MADVKRQLSIKSGIVRRLTKELSMYEEEKKQEQTRVDKLKADGADSHDIKHAVSLLEC
jgi:tubulin-specific chaperone A